MNTEIVITLLSGQFLLVVWQIIKEVRDRRNNKKKAQEEAIRCQNNTSGELKLMVFTLYRDSLRDRILQIRRYIDYPQEGIDLTAELVELRSDMKLYIQCGGNGVIKRLYLNLKDYVRSQKGEALYSIMCIEELHH